MRRGALTEGRSRRWEKDEVGEQKTVMKGKMEVAGLVGPLWFIGWLFTIGFADLSFWGSVVALVIWPYYLGSALG